MPTTVEAQGLSIDEAIQVALNQLGVGRDKVEIKILHHPRSGFLGIGARRAKVRATLREGAVSDGQEFDMSPPDQRSRGRRRRRSGRRGRGAERNDEGHKESEEARNGSSDHGEVSQRASEKDKGRSRSRSRRGGDSSAKQGEGRGRQSSRNGDGERRRSTEKSRGGRAVEKTAEGEQRKQRATGPERQAAVSRKNKREAVAGERSDSKAGGRGRNRANGGEERSRERGRVSGAGRERRSGAAPEDDSAKSPAAMGTGTAEVLDAAELRALGDRVHELVVGLMAAMGFDVTIASSVDAVAREVVVQVRSDSEGLLIGRRGQTLDALEHLINRMALSGEGASEGRIQVDIGGYRLRRKESLNELALRLKERALKEGKAAYVSPMSPRDRRFFQQALEGSEEVETRALGSGFYRRVAVVPVGAEGQGGAEASTARESAPPPDHPRNESERLKGAAVSSGAGAAASEDVGDSVRVTVSNSESFVVEPETESEVESPSGTKVAPDLEIASGSRFESEALGAGSSEGGSGKPGEDVVEQAAAADETVHEAEIDPAAAGEGAASIPAEPDGSAEDAPAAVGEPVERD